MKRIIVDYKKLDKKLACALLGKYPQGYGDEDIISFRNARGEWIEAVELPAGDTLYLVKISQSLSDLMAQIEDWDCSDSTDEFHLEEEYDGSLETDLSLQE